MKKFFTSLLIGFLLVASLGQTSAQHSVAREWNELLLNSIRGDYARPTVHARNLFHTSVAMYDAWAAYDTSAQTYFLGHTLRNYTCPFEGVPMPFNVKLARNEAISFAAFRLLSHRFANSPDAENALDSYEEYMIELGYDVDFEGQDYQSGNPAALGNYIAEQIIAFGLQDGSNEEDVYENQYYEPVNEPLYPIGPGNPTMSDPNHWQPLTLDVFIDQSGNVIPISTPAFLGPEWGKVTPFALSEDDLKINFRGEDEYWVYHDPGAPPMLDTVNGGLSDNYKWNFALVAIWGSHLHPSDGVMIDISPATFGNIDVEDYPMSFDDFDEFYDLYEGGDISKGHDLNPITGQPYEPQMVPRGDYARVLAEFWADGPDSETPPGHWFTILNYVNDHPAFEKRYKGVGPLLDNLEWDVKAYLTLGGAVHDAAVTAWGVKGWYDYIRPISAIRYMADKGQSTDSNLPSYHPAGIPLHPGYIELVEPGDPLAGPSAEHVGKIKLYTWRGPDYIQDPETDEAGVGWILAENWWPYQRPTFITPPFAGYVSGHSTFSRAAAEVMTRLTGDPFFPGGMGEFHCDRNEFLVFEDGPSQSLTLQWATYRDASEQTSLSRIWGGIHPPADDIPGRLMGIAIGNDAFEYADCYFKSPTYQEGEVELECRASSFEWFVDAEGVDFWDYTASINDNVMGATGGTVGNGGMASNTLINTSDTAQTVLYTFVGYLKDCEVIVQEIEVTILPDVVPTANFDVEISDSTVNILNSSSGATSYLWDFGDGVMDSLENPQHKYEEDGEYTIQLIASSACGSDTVTMVVQISTSAIADATVERFFTAFPNPGDGKFILQNTGLSGSYDLTVFDVTGRVVHSEQLSIMGTTRLDLSRLGNGIYYAVLQTEAVRDVVKLVIQQ